MSRLQQKKSPKQQLMIMLFFHLAVNGCLFIPDAPFANPDNLGLVLHQEGDSLTMPIIGTNAFITVEHAGPTTRRFILNGDSVEIKMNKTHFGIECYYRKSKPILGPYHAISFGEGTALQNSRTRLEGLLESCQRYGFEHDPERKLSYWCQIYKDEFLIGIMRYGIKDKI